MLPDRPGHRTPYDTRRASAAQGRGPSALFNRELSRARNPCRMDLNLLLGGEMDVKTVQARLTHADAGITLNWYAHAMPGNDRQAADLLAAIMEHPEKVARTA